MPAGSRPASWLPVGCQLSFPVDEVLLGREPVHLAMDDLATLEEQQVDEVGLRGRRRFGRRRNVWMKDARRNPLACERDAAAGLVIQQSPVERVDDGLE